MGVASDIVTSPRLQAERDRLYRAEDDGRVRALVLSLARPADWAALGRAWQGVQTDLGWPAPGIAVSGTDACQLWFSLAEPVSPAEAHALLEHLRTRYLADIPPHRVELLPSVEGAHLAPVVPALQAGGEVWSAYIAPDLAPVFAETPWLDIRPGSEGQAELLSRLSSIHAAEYRAALPAAPAGPVPAAASGAATSFTDPRQFLLSVMNDAQVEMALRIEAAKALIPRA
jgi:hypothetical protein